MGDDRRVVRIGEQLAIRALATDGAGLDADVVRAGFAQLGELIGDSLSMSGATEAAVSFGLDVDADLGAVVITSEGAGVIDAYLAWDSDDAVFLWAAEDSSGIADDDELDPDDTEFDFDDDDEYEFEEDED